MAILNVTKTTAENVVEILAANESTASLIHSGESLVVYALQAIGGVNQLIINSSVGDDLIIDFN